MRLKDILKDTGLDEPSEAILGLEIGHITSDSREAKPGSLFVALQGPMHDGAKFIPQVVNQDTPVIIKQGDATKPTKEKESIILTTPDTHIVLEKILRNFYNDVSKRIKVIGITGTNGKTTITYLLESIFENADMPCGVIGTINYRYGGKIFEAKNTTPGMIENHKLLNDMATAGCKYCAIEVSSHALDQCRTAGIDFAGAIFTNLTSDHLDYHQTRDDYFLAKAKLFSSLSPSIPAVINSDDEYSDKLIKLNRGKTLIYSVKNKADFYAKKIKLNPTNTEFVLITPGGEIAINTPLIGLHNISNILAAAGIAHEEGLDSEQIKKGIEKLTNVPGRLENVPNNKGFAVLVDYAHTEDALVNVLSILREVCRGKIITVFGCGGDRDKTKRPKMGKVATEMSDFAIITSDNPRSENPEQIANDILAGITKANHKTILDRETAIKEATAMAQPNDCVLIAGKGHEDYQIFKDKTIHFDDREIAKKFL